ncbi:hypothetical protein NIES4106_09820 [Fischerella sp. NIES-4106]|jgi:hypothetical protein|nr:hypothetical protein NIES4106_09820 [Fischerella sp. NIES-4106]
MKLHIILTPPNLPLVRGGAEGGGVLFMHLHMEMVLVLQYQLISVESSLFSSCS